MPVDLSVFERIKTKDDFDREREAFEQRKMLGDLQQQKIQAQIGNIESGGNLPATIQIANEIEKAKQAGDTERATLLAQTHKMFDKGIDPYGAYSQHMGNIPTPTMSGIQEGLRNDSGYISPTTQRLPSNGDFLDVASLPDIGLPENLIDPNQYQNNGVGIMPGYADAVAQIEGSKKQAQANAQSHQSNCFRCTRQNNNMDFRGI